jgi:hypothetical protein
VKARRGSSPFDRIPLKNPSASNFYDLASVFIAMSAFLASYIISLVNNSISRSIPCYLRR